MKSIIIIASWDPYRSEMLRAYGISHAIEDFFAAAQFPVLYRACSGPFRTEEVRIWVAMIEETCIQAVRTELEHYSRSIKGLTLVIIPLKSTQLKQLYLRQAMSPEQGT